MQSRIPLSIVFSAEGKRHAIPHCTFRVPLPRPGATPTSQQQESIDFFHYLDSNDTRLPSHPHLSAYAQPAEEYETYVGEEVWEKKAAQQPLKEGRVDAVRAPAASSCASPDTAGGAAGGEEVEEEEVENVLRPVPAFHGLVEWVNRVFDEEDWARDGVVLCGRYVVADDGAWVVPSRSPTLFSTREVFLLMRNSCKFLCDVHAQVKAMATSSSKERPSHGAASSPLLTCLEFTLAKSLAGSGASEMRAVLPYPIHFSPNTQRWVTEDTAASLAFTGIGQRMTDACFPSLMAWTEDEHDEHFRAMRRRIEQAALLERTAEVDPAFINRLVERYDRQNSAAGAGRRELASPQHNDGRLTLLLTVDLLFEGPSLPIYVLSAKARVFEVVQRTDAAWADLLGVTASWPLWTPLLRSTEQDGEEHDNMESGAAPDTSNVVADTSNASNAHDTDSEEDEAAESSAVSALNFFRMFRDVAHWNQYVAAMVQRLHEAAAADADDCAESNKPSRNVQHYCVIAAESGDLVTCADTMTKRGLPLELMHPELLEQNEDAAAFLKMLRDGLFKKANGSA